LKNGDVVQTKVIPIPRYWKRNIATQRKLRRDSGCQRAPNSMSSASPLLTKNRTERVINGDTYQTDIILTPPITLNKIIPIQIRSYI